MGIRLSLHVGPYAECTFTLQDGVVAHWGCDNSSCHAFRRGRWSSHNKPRFCQDCGCEMRLYHASAQVESVSAHSVAEELGDKLFLAPSANLRLPAAGMKHVYLPNRKLACWDAPEFNADTEEAYAFEITPRHITRQTEAFMEQFARELSVLKLRYGDDEVAVRWGLVQYWI